MLENAADRASEPQANIAQPKRESAWPPQRPVHYAAVSHRRGAARGTGR